MTAPISLLCMIITFAIAFCAPVSLMSDVDDVAISSVGRYISVDAGNMVEHTSVSGKLKYNIPSDMVVVNGATKEDLLSKIDIELIMDTYDMDEQGVSDMLDYVLEEDCSDYDLIYTADFFGIMRVSHLPDFGITPDYLPDAKEELDELDTSSYIDLGATEEDLVSHGIISVGENPNEWYKFSASVEGVNFATYMTCNDSGDMFSLDFCDIPEETALAIVESVELLDADAAPSKDEDAESAGDAKSQSDSKANDKPESDTEAESDVKPKADAAESMDYTSVTGLFTCKIPGDMILLNGATKEDFLNQVDIARVMRDWHLSKKSCLNLIDSILEEDCSYYDVIYTDNLIGSLSIEHVPDTGVTQNDLPLAQKYLEESLIEFYTSIGADEEDCVSCGIVEVGDNPNSWYKFYVHIDGNKYSTYTTCNSSGDMIYVDVYNVPDEQALAVIESIELIEAGNA